jgi:adenylate cyclase
MRFLPNIRYGTEGYPEKVARRLRTLNVTAWIAAAAAGSAAVVHCLDPTPGLWKLGSVDAIAAALFASVPLLHRFGPILAALALVVVADTIFLPSFASPARAAACRCTISYSRPSGSCG